jgi:hypothetical protein
MNSRPTRRSTPTRRSLKCAEAQPRQSTRAPIWVPFFLIILPPCHPDRGRRSSGGIHSTRFARSGQAYGKAHWLFWIDHRSLGSLRSLGMTEKWATRTANSIIRTGMRGARLSALPLLDARCWMLDSRSPTVQFRQSEPRTISHVIPTEAGGRAEGSMKRHIFSSGFSTDPSARCARSG